MVKADVEALFRRMILDIPKFIKRITVCRSIINRKIKIILCPVSAIFDVELDIALKIMRRTISWEKIENSFLYDVI